MKAEVRDLEVMLETGVSLLVIESPDESRVLQLMTRLAMARSTSLFCWSAADGLRSLGFGERLDSQEYTEPEALLRHIRAYTGGGLFVLCDFHPYLKDEPLHIRLLKEIAMSEAAQRSRVVLLSHALSLPEELRHYGAHFELAMPSQSQLMGIIREEAQQWSSRNQEQRVKTDSRSLNQLVDHLRGLTWSEARKLARTAIVDDGAIDASDVEELKRSKFALINRDDVLSYEFDTAKFADVGGLEAFKGWLSQRRSAFLEPQDGADIPKGVMLLGVQGSGKSLAAKAVAGVWNLPLLRLDFGVLYNKYFGETERNLRRALQLAESMAPAVLWVDEIEKSIASGDNDQGTSRRILGTLLTWMAERNNRVFLVATSNDISRLPPELIRKGRLDEIFFVDLPDTAIREQILSIHLHKRDQDPAVFDLARLAELSEGFSGAELEQLVVSALYRAENDGGELQQIQLEQALGSTQALSVVMDEDIAALRYWAKDRTVPAH
ncbi:AAA family ATPase [Aestuariirhabdus sp. Z084]|uniref:AAA family ATPase n=1 Tax=Aestuariirhabdus haliotis TaxID=2918751 RepID=UPI00201B4658|nr:AAA family ATPase [Aestuariirhabdus haliotis]MCL6416056.1 AAA family ATPase [Aestuariirhabdus haliotis]MCL6419376.1 AAA family ATPase [Aestuariirhabdus haliotis]